MPFPYRDRHGSQDRCYEECDVEIAELFEHDPERDRFDPTALCDVRQRLIEHLTRHDALGARLADIGSVLLDGAAITEHTLRPFLDRDGIPSGALVSVCRVAVLSLVVDRHAGELTEGLDAEQLALAATGELASSDDPVLAFIVAIRDGLQPLPGWTRGGTQWSADLADLLQGWAQESRLLPTEHAAVFGPALAAATRGGWIDLFIETGCLATGDETRAKYPELTARVARLAGSVVGLARDLGRHIRGEGSSNSKDLVCQRFAVAPHVIRMSESQMNRALRAILELEVRDLLDVLGRLDKAGSRAEIVRRCVYATLHLDGSAHAVTSATTGPRPDRRSLMDEMRQVARSDGKITTDERALLRGMDAHLLTFSGLLDRVHEDAYVDEDELEQLRLTRQRILDDLFRIALSDQHISADERELLLRAMELLPTLR